MRVTGSLLHPHGKTLISGDPQSVPSTSWNVEMGKFARLHLSDVKGGTNWIQPFRQQFGTWPKFICGLD